MWLYENVVFEQIPEGIVGFVYCITNLTNSRKYLGKKNFYFSKTKTVKGKKKRFKVESDWRDYYGSNKELNADVTLLGKENFKREILKLCKSKGEFGYYEAKYQFENNVLESDDWYNSWIMVRIHKKHLTFLKNQV
jgi:hypothetical protein